MANHKARRQSPVIPVTAILGGHSGEPAVEVEMLMAAPLPPAAFVKTDKDSHALYGSYRSLVERVRDVFGDDLIASKWLSTPSTDFDSRPPIEVAQQHGYDLAVLEPVLIRIEHGVDF